MEINHLPIIDWELSMKLAGNKSDLAEEILQFFITNLSNDIAAINELYEKQNYSELHKKIHNLHGALCYCGLPRLKNIVARLETSLKNNLVSGLVSLLHQLHAEVNLLLEHYSLRETVAQT